MTWRACMLSLVKRAEKQAAASQRDRASVFNHMPSIHRRLLSSIALAVLKQLDQNVLP